MKTTSPPSLLRRSAAWFILAITGNLTVIAVTFVLTTTPVEIPASDTATFLFEYVEPMYRPELLIFTTLLGLIGGFRPNSKSDSEGDEAVRIVAWIVRGAIAFVLSFAVVVLVVKPTMLATVLFATLLGFAMFTLAERLAPPVPLSITQRFLKSDRDLAARKSWSDQALGSDIEGMRSTWSWAVMVAYASAPVALQTVLGATVGSAIWGEAFGLSPTWLAVSAATSFGSVILTFAWFAMADKADSRQIRTWRGVSFATLGIFASAVFAAIFFVSGKVTWPVGALILAVTALQATALWLPLRWRSQALLRRVAATVTLDHLERTRLAHAEATRAWEGDEKLFRDE